MTKRPDVQGLRAVAVGLVVLDHAGVPWLRGGFVGVDVFFVVSGFLITSLLVGEAAKSGRVRMGAFYARRARRILPAATVVLVATTLWAAVVLSTTRAQRVADDALWSAFFAANVHFASIGTDYFAQGQAESPLQHFWSLAVEEQFYVVWPGLLAVIVVLRRRWRLLLVVVVAMTCVASFVWSVVLADRSVTEAYFSSPARAWELGLGALLALTSEQVSRIARWRAEVLAGIGLTAIVASAVWLGRTSSFSSWQLVVPVLGTTALLAAGCGDEPTRVARVLSLRPVQWVGDASYSLYLWHWPVLVLGAQHTGASASGWESAGLVTLTTGLAALSYYLVENPFRRSRLVWAGPRRGLLLWPIAVGATIASTLWSGHLATAAEQDQVKRAERYYENEELEPKISLGPATVADSIARSLELADDRAPLPVPLKNLDGLEEDLWNKSFDCHAAYVEITVRICPLGNQDSRRTVVAFGDSHMGMWLPALDVLGRRHDFKVVPFIKYSCAPYDVPMAIKEVGGDYTECQEFRAWVIRQLEALEPNAILLAARGLAQGLATTSNEERAPEWEQGVRSTVTELKTYAPVVKLLADIPEQDNEPADCLTSKGVSMATCISTVGSRVQLSNDILRRVSRQTQTDYVDVTALICLDGRCPIVVDRTVTYADNDHISVTWAKAVARELGALLTPLSLSDGSSDPTSPGLGVVPSPSN